ncbi:MAG: PAS domain-containing protein [Chloroflexota bacterium]
MNAREETKSTAKGGLGYLAELPMIAFDAVAALDPQDRITLWNPAAEKMFGWSTREAIGKTSAELFWPNAMTRAEELRLTNFGLPAIWRPRGRSVCAGRWHSHHLDPARL